MRPMGGLVVLPPFAGFNIYFVLIEEKKILVEDRGVPYSIKANPDALTFGCDVILLVRATVGKEYLFIFMS